MSTTPTISEQNTTQAGAALAHWFVGLMKADGYISSAEERKVEILVHKFRRGLPCTSEDVLESQAAIMTDATYGEWRPKQHLDSGFERFDTFVKSGDATEDHMSTILEMLEILAEVDGVTDTEQLFLDLIREGFLNRYGTEV
jgi:hypothetical protein